jgi:carbon-monoxide dehydrogenase medium subunit
MKAPAFSYTRVTSIAAALDLLAQHGDEAKLLSGGQSLMPALNLRLLAPAQIIDIGGIAELRGIVVGDGLLRIGALTRHVDLLTSPEIAAQAPLLTEAVAHVAHPAIRNKGTIGGNLAHADPASELPACMLALDATIVAHGPNGERKIAANDFFTGIYETALTPQELLTAVEIPVAKQSIHFFQEYARRNGDYAMAGLAATAVVERDVFTSLRLGFFAVGDRPILAEMSGHLVGRPVTTALLAEAAAALDAELDPQEDHQASAAMRRYFARQLLQRCVATLLRRPELEMRKSA